MTFQDTTHTTEFSVTLLLDSTTNCLTDSIRLQWAKIEDGFLERGNITLHAGVWNHFDWRAAQIAAPAPQTVGLSANLVQEHLHKLAASTLSLHSQRIYKIFLSSNFPSTYKIKKDLAHVKYDGMSYDISSLHPDVCSQRKTHQDKSEWSFSMMR